MGFSKISFLPGSRTSRIVLQRPPLNIIDLEMIDELLSAWTEVEGLGSTVVVISGAGDRAFSAGVDVRDHLPERVDAMLSGVHRLVRRIRQSPVVSIAALRGSTLGGGAELALSCDFVVTADDLRFGFPEIQLACFPPVAAASLTRALGRCFSSEMILLGAIISASEASSRGLVNAVAAPGELDATVQRYVDRLLSLSAPVIRLAKRALNEGESHAFEEALTRCEALYREELIHVEDMKEGLQAFLDKRTPDWRHQ